MIRKFLLWVLISLFFILAACSNNTVEKEETTLRIGILHDDARKINDYRQDYTQLFQIENPHVDIEFVSAKYDPNHILKRSTDYDSVEEMTSLMEQSIPPDVVILDYGDYVHLASEGRLIALDELMKEIGVLTDDYHPTVIEGLLNTEDNQLYGLTRSFSSYALAYNKQIFDEAGVQVPQDHMTWDEIFALAQSVTVKNIDDPIYGLSFYRQSQNAPDLGSVISFYTSMLFKPYDEKIMDVNNEQWREIFSTFKNLNDNHVFPTNPLGVRQEPKRDDHFLSGRLAMTLMHYSEVLKFAELQDNPELIEGFEPFDWDIVTMPVHDEAPDEAPGIRYGSIFAINANAQNVELAWELISFIHKQKQNEGELLDSLASQEWHQNMGVDYNVDAFYKLKPPLEQPALFGGKGYNQDVIREGAKAFHYYMIGEWSLDEALEYWEAEGNLALQDID